MSILVDAARWPWRGTLWCHLVSDSDLEELHTFAAELGCRRVGFQGDHYDIDIDDRERALAAGAIAVDSRELVLRLRQADLRVRPSGFEKWSLVDRSAEPPRDTEITRFAQRISTSFPGAAPAPLAAVLSVASSGQVRQLLSRSDGWFVIQRSEALALVIYGSGQIGIFEQLRGIETLSESVAVFDRHRPTTSGREWSVELVSPPLSPQE